MGTSSFKTLVTAWVGDIHLGHHETKTNHILTNLYRAFPNDASLAGLDILFIEGDVFDRLLSFSDEVGREIKLWMYHLLSACKKHDVALRVLEGTPSHDWKQSKWFVSVNEDMGGIHADLKYIDKLCIDFEERFGVYVLYVPDEWRPTPQQTQAEVEALMADKGLPQVDIACMHGYFPPQLPSQLAHGAHDLDFYLQRVRYIVGIGHVHRYWRHQHIVATGSFDRISHGEHEPKGHTVITLHHDKPGQPDVVFVENENAKRYVTVDCRDRTDAEAKQSVEDTACRLPKGSAIRIVCRSSDTMASSLPYFKTTYPYYTWKLTRKDKGQTVDDDDQLIELVDTHQRPSVMTLTPENVVDLMDQRLTERVPDIAPKALARLVTLVAQP